MPHDPENIETWLASLGLPQYASIFKSQRIDLDVLAELTNSDLKELGVALGDRKRMLRAIASARSTGQEPATLPPRPAGARRTSLPGSAERRQVTIVFVDLVGSTELAARLDPEELGTVMRAYQRRCASVVDRWQGHLAEFLGDGAVIYFGWPRAHEDDAERAVYAALELTQAASGLSAVDGSRLGARAGIATGMVVVGEIRGAEVSQREGALGETPNLAARLQALGRSGDVVLAAQTRRLIGDRFDVQSLGQHALKGFSDPVEAWRVVGVLARKSRFDARGGDRGRERALVGRADELAALTERWEACRSGTGGAILIRGDPGIGKSRLLRAFVELTREASPGVIELHCSPFHVNTPLLPFIDWLKEAAGIAPDAEPAAAVHSLDGYALRLGLDPAKSVPLLAALLSLPAGAEYPLIHSSARQQREHTLELLADILERVTAAQPAVITVEDLHWADPTTVEALRRLVQRVATWPACLVMTARSEFQPPFEAVPVLELGRLPLEMAGAMVASLTDRKSLPPAVIDTILGSADGVPLFVEELTRALVDSGRLHEAGDHYEVAGAQLDLEVPATLHDLLVARLDSLPAGKEVAQVAAALGRSFSLQLLRGVAPTLEPRLVPDLTQLVEAGILVTEGTVGGDATYAFRHALVREAAYHSQLKARRREVHRRAAAVLERDSPAVVAREPELLAHHHGEGGQPMPAAGYLLKAGQRALQAGATREATAYLERGLHLLAPLAHSPERDRTELHLQAILGTCFMQARGWGAEEVAKAYTAAANLSHAAESAAEAIWILWGLWVYYQVRGRISEALEASERIQRVATGEPDADGGLVGDMIALQVLLYAGRFAESRERCESFRRRYDRARHRALTDLYSTDLELVFAVHYSLVLWIQGEAAESARVAQQAETLAAQLDHAYSVAWGSAWGSVVDILLGRVEHAAIHCEQGLAIAREHDYAYVSALGEMIAGWIDGVRGDLERGVDRIGAGLKAFASTGAALVVPFFRTLQAELCVEQGRPAEALALLDAAQWQIAQWGECWSEAEVHRVRGNALAIQAGGGQNPAVEASYRRAIEIATRQGARGWRLRASTDLVRFLARNGRTEEARELLEPIRAAYAAGPATPDSARAERLAQQLATVPPV